MNIFVASNDAYYPQLKIFAFSLAKHTSTKISLKVLYSNLSKNNIFDFLSYTEKIGIDVNMVYVGDNRADEYKLIHQITVETYYRFNVLNLYPTEDRALWMDIDTVILQDIADFYYTDFDNNYVVACPGNNCKNHLKRLHLATDGCYFNAGVILFNLKTIRNDFSASFLYDVYDKNENLICLLDQDVLNIAFAGRIKPEEKRKYNYTVTSGQKNSRNELKQIKSNVAVIHYIEHALLRKGKRKQAETQYSYGFAARWLSITPPLYRQKTG